MIELQFLNKILQDKSLSLARQNNIGEEHFIVYDEEYKFIVNHYEEYGNVPDETTILDEFPEFDILEIDESNRYLVNKLKDNYLFANLAEFVRELAKKTEEDTGLAVNYLKQKMEEFNEMSCGFREGVDLVKDSQDRLNEFKERAEKEDLLGISTGIDELDEITNGWQRNGDFVSLIARTSQGKTWLLLFFLVQAWKQGERVLLYNGEMPTDVIGYRFDTLNKHFNNKGLTKGDKSLEEDYEEYINGLKEEETPFIMIKPKDIQGNLTPNKLEQLIDKYKPTIVGIDQISLMKANNEHNRMGRTERYESVTADLYQLAEKKEVAILAPHQANRNADTDDDIEEFDEIETPELTHVYGSDAISHNCRRVITFHKVDKITKFSIKKNNFGEAGVDLLMLWDMNRGLMKPFLKSTQTKEGEKVENVDKSGVELF